MKPVVQARASVAGRPKMEDDDEAVEAVDEAAERTERWTEASIAAAADAARAHEEHPGAGDEDSDGRVVTPAPPANLCVTVASRIPEMLAESMSLAGEEDPPVPPKR